MNMTGMTLYPLPSKYNLDASVCCIINIKYRGNSKNQDTFTGHKIFCCLDVP